MSEPASASPRWKRRIVRILATLALAPWLLLLLGNLLLATPWARGLLARKISARTGVEATIGSASLTPWGGGFLGEVVLLQPEPLRDAIREPLLKVRGIRVTPRWDRLLRGELEIAGIHIDRPQGAVSLEMLASLVSAAGEVAPPSAPPAVAVVPTPAPHQDDLPPVQGPALPPAAPPRAPAGPPSLPGATAWVELVEADCDFLLAGVNVVRITGVDGKIPVRGAPASSSCGIGKVEAFGRSLGSGLSLPLFWKAPELRCQAVELPFAGLKWSAAGVLGVMPGAPFAAEVVLPVQAMDLSPHFQTLRPTASRAEARLQAIGLLRRPSTWQGGAGAAVEDIALTLGGQPVAFDEGGIMLALQGGQLQCPDARLTGDRMSLLGNGQLGANGQGTAVLRVVVPPDVAEYWIEHLTPSGRRPVFSPMETPDRQFIDLRWVSYPGGQGIELGAGGPVVPLGELGNL